MSAPQISECPLAGGQIADKNTNTQIVVDAEKIGNPDKELATLRARAALAGVVLYAATDDHGRAVYVVSRWALTRHLDSLKAVADWLDRVTGVQS